MKRLFGALTAGALLTSCGSSSAPVTGDPERGATSRPRPTAPSDPLDQMVLAFKGGYSKAQIKARLENAMQLYSLPLTSEQYSRAGSVLVVMRKESGFAEMEILDHMIRSHVPGVKMEFHEMAAWSATALESGDH